jgi:putative hydrolase of the HAD superfamily
MTKIASVKGVFFDYGGVIEDLQSDEASFAKGVSIITEMLGQGGIGIEKNVLAASLRSGQSAYEQWYLQNDYRELPGEELWTLFLLKEHCPDEKTRRKVEGMAEALSSIYEFYLFKRRPPARMVEVLKTLFQNRFVMALVSNTLSRTLIPERLRKFGVERFFTSVVLSADTGVRKPRPAIFEYAFKRTGLEPHQCVYLGDTLSRDIEGAREAEFRYTVLIESGITREKDRGYRGSALPDFTIKKLEDLLPLLLG